jgi:hypothetical protein
MAKVVRPRSNPSPKDSRFLVSIVASLVDDFVEIDTTHHDPVRFAERSIPNGQSLILEHSPDIHAAT